MEYIVVKRDGVEEPFDFDKIYKHMKRACDGLKVDVNKLVENFKIRMNEKMESANIQRSLYSTAASLTNEDEPDWQYASARLLKDDLYQRIYGGHTPKFDYSALKDRIEMGFYDKEILEHYTEDEFNELASYINFERDDNFTYLGLTQMIKKYSIRRNGLSIETPQEIFFLIGAYIFSRNKNKAVRKKKVLTLYEKLSTFKIFLATPPMCGIRSLKRGFTSCAGIDYGDSIESFGNATKNMLKLITRLNAGIGAKSMNIRGLGADIGSGQDEHTGLIPYLKIYEAISRSSTQPNSGRSGAITNYYPFFHCEIEDIMTLKNNKGSDENSVRFSDHSIVFNKLFYERVKSGKEICLFHLNEVKELVEVMGEYKKFKKLYEAFEKDETKTRKFVSAEYILRRYYNERYITARLYKVNADEMQGHGAFDLPNVSSNLCLRGDTIIIIASKQRKGKHERIYLRDAKIGDLVLSRNTETKMDEFKRISNVAMTNPKAEVLQIVNGVSDIVCTPEHKVWTENRGYVKAKDIKRGDNLRRMGFNLNESVIVPLENKIPVYDITVEDNNNFYANGILVHNCTEINLPSFPDEKLKLKVKDKGKFESFIQASYENGTWYDIYRVLYLNIKPDDLSIYDELNKFINEDANEDVEINFGEIFSCILGGINIGILPKNIKARQKEIKESMGILVGFLDEMIDYQDYADIKAFEKFTRKRRALGISPGNLFYMLARNNVEYNSQEARDLVNDVSSEMLYYGIDASVELAKEKGKCEYFADTKYSKGILPIDTYNKNVDKLLSRKENLDWEDLRQRILKHGMRNSTIMTSVPSSNGSRPANMISGINPPQGLEYVIEDQKIKVTGVVPEVKKYKEWYKRHICWELDMIEYWKLLAIIQKNNDQAISINEYIDFTKYPNKKIPLVEVLKRDLFTNAFGLKSIYYAKTKTEENEDDTETSDTEGCSSGGCTL